MDLGARDGLRDVLADLVGGLREAVQEACGVLLAHLAVRLTMYEATTRASVDPDRLSFTGS